MVLCALRFAHGWVSWEEAWVVGGGSWLVCEVCNHESGAQGLDFPDFPKQGLDFPVFLYSKAMHS